MLLQRLLSYTTWSVTGQGEDGAEDLDDDEDGGRVDWTGEAAKAREAVLEADQTASGQELHYRLLLEEARTNAAEAAAQVSQSVSQALTSQPAMPGPVWV